MLLGRQGVESLKRASARIPKSTPAEDQNLFSTLTNSLLKMTLTAPFQKIQINFEN